MKAKESINSNLMGIYHTVTFILFIIFISVGVYYFKQSWDMGEVSGGSQEVKLNLFYFGLMSCLFSLFLFLHIIIVTKIITKINLEQ